jgi:DNA-binding winged helix-turn-helix (wHTH) protein/predicted ATPase
MAEVFPNRHGSVIRYGPFQLDRVEGLRRGAEEIRITPKSLSVLWELASRAGQLATKDDLFRAVWADAAVGDSALTSCIQELRQALGDDPKRPSFIETLHRRGYRFIAETSVPTLDEPRHVATETKIVGREHVAREILKIWDSARSGARQLLFLTGEAGIGKTTVAQHALAAITAGGKARAAWGLCVQHYGIGEPYQPLLEALMRLCRQQGGAELVAILERYAPTWLAQLPGLLQPERHASLQRTVVGSTRERMLRELTDALEAATERVPLVLCLEDLHWSDPSTLDWLASFAQRPEPAQVLVIGTFRPESEAQGGRVLQELVDALRLKRLCRDIGLSGMTEAEVGEYLALRLPPAPGHTRDFQRLAGLIHRHTGGNPLFVLNVVDDLLARGLIAERDGAWTPTSDLSTITLGTPEDVRRMIASQVDRLPAAECAVLEVASVAGAAFSVATVAGAAGLPEGEVETTLTRLEGQHRFVRRRGAQCAFDHVLYRDVLYDRVPCGRRAILHREVAAREETAYGERASEIAAELAMHFERSGDPRRAAMYLQQAAENARSRSAYSEAGMHFERALALIQNEPASRERADREIGLWIGRGAAAMAARGWGSPEAERAYSRARVLCEQHRESPARFPALWGLWLFSWGRGLLAAAHEIAHELLELAHSRQDEDLLLQAHHAAWATAFGRGELRAACFHAGEGIRLYDRRRHAAMAATYGSHDAGVCARLFLGRASALMGRTEDAIRASDDAIALARDLQHPFSLAFAYVFASAAAQACRQTDRVRDHAAAAAVIARDQDFRLLLAWSSAFEGWAAAMEGSRQEALSRIVDAMTDARNTGTDWCMPHVAGVAAEACLVSGRIADGLDRGEEGLQIAVRTGERFWQPELLRLKGELQIARDPQGAKGEAEQVFRDAIADARSQGAALLALRAAVSLGRTLIREGRGNEAPSVIRELLVKLDQCNGRDIDEARTLMGDLDAEFVLGGRFVCGERVGSDQADSKAAERRGRGRHVRES